MRRRLNQALDDDACAGGAGGVLVSVLLSSDSGSALASFRYAIKAVSSVSALRLRRIASGVSLTSTLPACISDMRSQRSASFMKWVVMKMVTLSLRARSIINCQNTSRAIGSTPEVGSSRISSAGLCTIATASDRR